MSRALSHITLAIALLVLLAACQTAPTPKTVLAMPTGDCTHLKRDLTLPWTQRTYWCVPKNYRGALGAAAAAATPRTPVRHVEPQPQVATTRPLGYHRPF